MGGEQGRHSRALCIGAAAAICQQRLWATQPSTCISYLHPGCRGWILRNGQPATHPPGCSPPGTDPYARSCKGRQKGCRGHQQKAHPPLHCGSTDSPPPRHPLRPAPFQVAQRKQHVALAPAVCSLMGEGGGHWSIQAAGSYSCIKHSLRPQRCSRRHYIHACTTGTLQPVHAGRIACSTHHIRVDSKLH